ncbi:hypothetical protein JD844_005738 [Phrynosoma platyrhinos]|uniref:Anti-proliferative protein domain-containing protein n=1 Tax=Phrynosoma platyrhinos TaxID=52577 RepID=A0ABQ7TQG6_PHRPL|nr:hypothetical protein JD844_005738 [Phrynosoma platyrhinos]
MDNQESTMKDDVGKAVRFLCRIVRTRNEKVDKERVEKFGERLIAILCERFTGHWYPEKPMKGQAYRQVDDDDDDDDDGDIIIINFYFYAASLQRNRGGVTQYFYTPAPMWVSGHQSVVSYLPAYQPIAFYYPGIHLKKPTPRKPNPNLLKRLTQRASRA